MQNAYEKGEPMKNKEGRLNVKYKDSLFCYLMRDNPADTITHACLYRIL